MTNTMFVNELNISLVDELIAFGRTNWRNHSDTYDAFESMVKDAISFSLEVNYHKGVIEGYQILALCHIAEGISEMALSALRLSEAFIQKFDLDESYYLELYNTYVIYYLDLLNDGQEAAKVCQKGMDLARHLKKERMLIKLTANLGIIHIMYKNFNLAKDEILKALAYFESRRENKRAMYCHSNLGEAYLGLYNYEKALEHYKIAMAMATIEHDEIIMEEAAIGLSQIYRIQQLYTKAIHILEKVLHSYSKKVRYSKGLKIQLELVDLYITLEDYDYANQKGIKIEDTIMTHPNKHFLLKYYDMKARISEGLGDYKCAYEMYKAYHDLYKELDQKKGDEVVNQIIESRFRKTIERLERLGNIGRRLTSLRNSEEVIVTFVKELSPLMNLSNIGVGIIKESKLHYSFYEVHAESYHKHNLPIDDPQSLSSWCITNKKELLIGNLPLEYENYVPKTRNSVTSDDGKTIKSLINLPLIVDDEVIGVITLQSYDEMAYSSEDLETMRVIAPYIAVAMVNDQQAQALKNMSYKDQLTGLLNRHGLDGKYQALIKQQKRFKSVTMFMLDLDYFKTINDRYGHLKGDEALRALGRKLAEYDNNKTTLVARLGGEEFGVLMVNKSEKDVQQIAEDIRRKVGGIEIMTEEGSVFLSTSIGVYDHHQHQYPSLENLYDKSDQALYQAKIKGKNRVEFYA